MAKAARNHQNQQHQGSTQHISDNDLTLTAPYNFVPLHRQVVRPEWAPLISHDKPFADGQSGQLTLAIEANQPIFTRNSVSQRITESAKKNELGSHFNKASDGRYLLPGSSIKGAIRNVLEIMSFGDLANGLVDERYSMRDLYHEDYKAMFALTAKHKVHGGWLYQSNGVLYLNDCGEPIKVPQKWIDEHFGTSNFQTFSSTNMRMNDDYYKAARKKYELFDGRDLNLNYDDMTGTLVFTGQPSANTNPKAKINEFLFKKQDTVLEVSKEVERNFRLAYYDSDKNAQKPDYKYWSERLKSGERIPVFFHKNDKGEVASFGLAYMYKIPFPHSVKDAIQRHQKDSGSGADLAECIFGHVEQNKALKGRIIFGHALAEGNPQQQEKKSEVLSSPKATYYPTYIKQNVKADGKINGNKYQTLFDKDAVPSGWKRYPVHSDGVKDNPGPKDRDGKIQTQFCPLAAGTTFACTVNYHNLKKIELGALLSALTFHQTPDCYHTLGMAKPLGYGKCTISVKGIDTVLMQECLCAFEQYMEQQLPDGWLKSHQLRELLSMSCDQENKGRSKLVYMEKVKDFATAKKEQLALDRYTKLEDDITPIIPKAVCESVTSEKPAFTRAVSNARDVFEQRRQQLIKGLKEEKNKRADKEWQERETEEQRRIGAEKERLQKEKEEEDKRKQEAANTVERTAGINLNGINERNTIDSMLRTLKRWVESLGGSIGEPEMEQIKTRFSQIYGKLKQKDKQTWSGKLKADISKLATYLSQAQIQQLEAHVNTFE